MMQDPAIREMFEKLQSHPPAIAAMGKFVNILKEKGFEADKPPSATDLYKIFMDKESMKVIQELAAEMKNAGIDVGNETFMNMMKAVSKK